MRALLGGKGANIAEMTRVLGPRPRACRLHDHDGGMRRLHARRARRAGRAGAGGGRGHRAPRGARRPRAGRSRRPAARVGALRRPRLDAGDARDDPRPRPQRRVRATAWPRSADDEHFAWDSYRRFVQMFGNVVARHPGRALRGDPAAARRRAGVREDRELGVAELREITRRFRTLYEAHTGEPFPQDPKEQLRLAIRAVFDSWLGERAVQYRRINHIPDDWGTAVNVQQMVFGNRGAAIGDRRRVLARRDDRRARAERGLPARRAGRGRRLRRAHAAAAARARRGLMPEAHEQLIEILRTLEGHYGDMQDTEFTVERGPAVHAADAQRQAPGPGRGALRRRRRRRGPAHRASRRWPRSTPARSTRCCTRRSTPRRASTCSRAASPRRRAPPRARSCSPPTRRSRPPPQGRDVILARPFTEADDVAGFFAAARHPHLRGRQGLARGARRARDGPARRSSAPASWRSTCARARSSVGDEVIAAGDADRDRRQHRHGHARRRGARRARAAASASSACSAGRTRSAGSACAPTPTRRPTPARRSSSAPRASACAGPSTCSWPPTASRRCAR